MNDFMSYWDQVNRELEERRLPEATWGQIHDAWRCFPHDIEEAVAMIEREYAAEAEGQ